jgi:hypothetical protein
MIKFLKTYWLEIIFFSSIAGYALYKYIGIKLEKKEEEKEITLSDIRLVNFKYPCREGKNEI